MLLAPMLASLQAPNDTVSNPPPRQMTASGPPAASSSSSKGAVSVTAAQPSGSGHVYYNRGLDVEEEESKATQHLEPRPIEIVGDRRLSSGNEVTVL